MLCFFQCLWINVDTYQKIHLCANRYLPKARLVKSRGIRMFNLLRNASLRRSPPKNNIACFKVSPILESIAYSGVLCKTLSHCDISPKEACQCLKRHFSRVKLNCSCLVNVGDPPPIHVYFSSSTSNVASMY